MRILHTSAGGVSRGARALAAAVTLAALFAVDPAGADTVRLGGTGAALGTMKVLGDAYRRREPQFTLEIVPNLGSSGGLRALERDAVHIAVAGRAVNKDEAARGLVSFEYGRTAFVLATARESVAGMTLAQIADAYSGRAGKWPDGTLIRLVLRPATDGDTALLASFSPGVKDALAQAMKREGMIVAMTDQDSASELTRVKGSLGTTSLALIISEQRPLTMVAIDGVAPSVRTLADGTYPYGKSLHIAMRDKPHKAALRFASFVRSPEGRRLLAETGHVVSAHQ